MNDVRLKVQLRMRAVLKFITSQAQPKGVIAESVIAARRNRELASQVQRLYRDFVLHEFPGCRVSFGRAYLFVYLPDGYPRSSVPVTVKLEPIHIEVFHPKGLHEL